MHTMNRVFYYFIHNITNIIIILFIVCSSYAFLSSCSVTKPTTVIPSTEIVNVRDSVIYTHRDSVVVVPVERVVDVVASYDTLKLENEVSIAKAYIDTTLRVLKGELKNKKKIEYQYKYIDRVVYKDSIQIVKEPVPYEVEKIVRKNPWYFPIVALFACIGLFIIIISLIKYYVKLKGT